LAAFRRRWRLINSKEQDPVTAIKEITGGGADFSLEATGIPAVLRQAIEALGSLGTCGIVGAARLGAEASFDINDVMLPGKSIMGIIEGNSVIRNIHSATGRTACARAFPFRQAGEILQFRPD
jgi:Zn-dependent alcohol dehydrogenase